MSPREFEAFSLVHEQTLSRWALQMAMFANANFKRSDPFTVDEFLGKPKKRGQTIKEKKAVMAGFKASVIKDPKQWESSEVPEWALALGRKQGIENG